MPPIARRCRAWTAARSLANGLPLASLLCKLRRLGRKDMFRVIRSLSMSAQEFTDDWFEAEPLKAAIGALAVHGVTLGAVCRPAPATR